MATKKAPSNEYDAEQAQPLPPAAESVRTAAGLVIGDIVRVTVRPGVVLRNTETGLHFVPGEPTTQRVTATLLRRLQDGDVQLVIALPA